MQVGQFSVPSFLAARAQHNTTQQHTGANAEVCAVVLPVVMNVPTPKQQHEEGYGDGRGVKGAIPIPVNQQGSKAISNTQIMSRAALLHVLLAFAEKMPKSQRWFFCGHWERSFAIAHRGWTPW